MQHVLRYRLVIIGPRLDQQRRFAENLLKQTISWDESVSKKYYTFLPYMNVAHERAVSVTTTPQLPENCFFEELVAHITTRVALAGQNPESPAHHDVLVYLGPAIYQTHHACQLAGLLEHLVTFRLDPDTRSLDGVPEISLYDDQSLSETVFPAILAKSSGTWGRFDPKPLPVIIYWNLGHSSLENVKSHCGDYGLAARLVVDGTPVPNEACLAVVLGMNMLNRECTAKIKYINVGRQPLSCGENVSDVSKVPHLLSNLQAAWARDRRFLRPTTAQDLEALVLNCYMAGDSSTTKYVAPPRMTLVQQNLLHSPNPVIASMYELLSGVWLETHALAWAAREKHHVDDLADMLHNNPAWDDLAQLNGEIVKQLVREPRGLQELEAHTLLAQQVCGDTLCTAKELARHKTEACFLLLKFALVAAAVKRHEPRADLGKKLNGLEIERANRLFRIKQGL